MSSIARKKNLFSVKLSIDFIKIIIKWRCHSSGGNVRLSHLLTSFSFSVPTLCNAHPVISYRYIYSVIDHIAVYDICKLSAHTSTATFTNINKHTTSLLSIVLRWWYTGRWRLCCYICYSKKGATEWGVTPRPCPSSDHLTICEAIVTCSKRWRVGCYIWYSKKGGLVGPQPAQALLGFAKNTV